MEKFGKSQSIKRFEDTRLLTGHGRYVDDIAPEGALHAYFLRSPVAHADITTLDVAEARALDGVHLVLTAADLEDAGLTASLPFSVMTNRDGSKGAAPHRPILARDRVRFVGEAVAIIVADRGWCAQFARVSLRELVICLSATIRLNTRTTAPRCCS